jgi:hypothetical protein
VRCGVENCGKKHNIALHDAWQEKTEAAAFLLRAKSPISLLTPPVILSSLTSVLQFDTNAIHGNGSTISLFSREIADNIGLQGESIPLGLAAFGNPNQVQQAFKTTIAIADADATHVGNAVVYIVDEFVQVQAVDWSSHSKDFAHLRSLNFPKPFREGRCHILLGKDNHHLTKSTQNDILAPTNPQSYPYALLTALGWCAAGPTLPPIIGDHLFNILAKSAALQQSSEYAAELSAIQTKVAVTLKATPSSTTETKQESTGI